MKLLIICLLISVQSSAQIGMQQWRIHFSLFEAIDITKTESKVLLAVKNGVIAYDLESNEIETISVTNGLSDLGISAISSQNETVFIGYSNGNLDLIKSNETINVPWLKRALISGNKSINNFLFYEGYVYISTGIGILLYDLEKEEITDTYYPYSSPEILDISILNDSIYAATTQGIYIAHVAQQFLNNTANWRKKTNLPIHVQNGKISQIEKFGNALFIALDIDEFNSDTLYKLVDDSLVVFEKNLTVKRILAQDGKLILSRYANIISYDSLFNEIKNIYNYSFGLAPSPAGAVLVGNEFWIADKNNGMVKAIDAFNNSSQIYANSPYLDGCYRMDIQEGKALIAGGGLTHNLHNNYARRGVYVFEDEEWTNINGKTHAETLPDSSNWDIIAVSINPKNTNQFAFAGYSRGGLKIVEDNKIVETYNYSNSILELQLGNFSHIITDLKYDDDGNLWIVNSGNFPLKMLDKDGNWHQYSLGGGAKNKFPYRLIIDSNGYKWIGFNNYGVVVFDDNQTYNDINDDRTAIIETAEGRGNLSSSVVKSIAEDIDGEVWIGTEDGIGVIYSSSSLFDGDYGSTDVSTIVIYDTEKADNVAIFDKVTVTAIAIDGGNRKWIGTNASGVFCMSANGKEEIYNFNSSNSPLISNSILDIKIDYESGEVYFVTEEGLISYRSDVTAGDNSFSNVKVYPNPVRPEYKGIITIEGVGYESYVKITDVSGNLVYETKSNGGSILWDGNRLTGERVQSGVYLVWSARKEGSGKNVAKILVIN